MQSVPIVSPDPSKIVSNTMKTVNIPVGTLETLIEGLQSALNVCYNVDSKEEETEKSYPYAVGYSEGVMKFIIKDLQRLIETV